MEVDKVSLRAGEGGSRLEQDGASTTAGHEGTAPSTALATDDPTGGHGDGAATASPAESSLLPSSARRGSSDEATGSPEMQRDGRERSDVTPDAANSEIGPLGARTQGRGESGRGRERQREAERGREHTRGTKRGCWGPSCVARVRACARPFARAALRSPCDPIPLPGRRHAPVVPHAMRGQPSSASDMQMVGPHPSGSWRAGGGARLASRGRHAQARAKGPLARAPLPGGCCSMSRPRAHVVMA